MKKLFSGIGFFIGWFLAFFCSNILAGIATITLGVLLGRYIGSSIEESQERNKARKEEQQKEEYWKKDRLRRALKIAESYPESAVKVINNQLGTSLKFVCEYNLTDEMAKALLAHSESEYSNTEQQLNPKYREKIEAQRMQIERQKEQERLAAERKRREEELEQKRKEDERRNISNILPSCVQDWETHSNSTLKHKYFYNYYPYSTYKNSASVSMKSTWEIVWHFKNDPSKYVRSSDHEYAQRIVVRKVGELLKNTFGSKTEYLTLVCLTASTQEKTDMRFKEFSEIVCNDLNMTNAYSHIHVAEEGIARREGGTGVQSISYERNFFNGKNVVLFDDVRTTGRSLETMRRHLEELGANVICAITIAQTKHKQ